MITGFTKYIESDPNNLRHYKETLKRVLVIKAKIAKNRNQNVGNLLLGNTDHWMLSLDNIDSLKNIQIKGKTTSIDSIVKKIMNASMVKINETSNITITNNDGMAQLDFYIGSIGVDVFKEKISLKYPRARIIENPLIKSPSIFEKIYTELKKSIINCEKVVFTVASFDDAKLIEAITEQYPKEAQQKLILFLHNTPTILDSSVIQKITVLGTCSYQKQAFYSDVDVLFGTLLPKNTDCIPINIGPDGSVYNCQKTISKISFAEGYTVLTYYATTLEKELKVKNDQKMNVILVLMIVIVVLLCLFIWTIFIRKAYVVLRNANGDSIGNKIKCFILRHIGKIIAIVGINTVFIIIIGYLAIGVYTINGSPELYKLYTDSIPIIAVLLNKPLYTYLGLSFICLILVTITTIGILNKNFRNILARVITRK
jgi:hypothetical protein